MATKTSCEILRLLLVVLSLNHSDGYLLHSKENWIHMPPHHEEH